MLQYCGWAMGGVSIYWVKQNNGGSGSAAGGGGVGGGGLPMRPRLLGKWSMQKGWELDKALTELCPNIDLVAMKKGLESHF